MEDLLREEEFITQKPYNPWKRFIVFYIIAFLNTIFLYMLTKFLKSPYDMIFGIPLTLLAPTMPFVMAFHKKDIAFASIKSIISGMCLLMLVYFISYIVTDVIENGIYFLLYTGHMTNFIILSCFIGYGLISALIIVPVISRKKKKLINARLI